MPVISGKLHLELVSYSDSDFTNPHLMVSHSANHDGRGTFSHMGVKMEGMESSRHIDFQAIEIKSKNTPNYLFFRDKAIRNRIVMRVKQPDRLDIPSKRAIIKKLQFDTSFFTRNNVSVIYDVIFRNENLDTGELIEQISLLNPDKPLALDGDSILDVDIKDYVDQTVYANYIILECNEGGLSRFNAFGDLIIDDTCSLEVLSNNASIFGASDISYGDASLVLRKLREGQVMAGWESCRHSARHRLGIDLKSACHITKIEIDTYLHRLNSFKFICILGYFGIEDHHTNILENLPKWKIYDSNHKSLLSRVDDSELNEVITQPENRKIGYELDLEDVETNSKQWSILLPTTKIDRDTLHIFTTKNHTLNTIGHVRYLILYGIPDGGIHRLGIFGERKVS